MSGPLSVDGRNARQMRYGASRMGGWKSLFWFAVAMAGVGFAGYVYLVPYQKMQHAAVSKQAEVAQEHGAAEAANAERERLKSDLAKFMAADKEKAEGDAKRKAAVDELATQLKAGLEELGANVGSKGGSVEVTFPAAKLIDANGIDVSEGGGAALKILAGAAKKASAKVRIAARSSSAPPPKELRSLFHSAGEMNAVRGARVMSALQGDGLGPDRIAIVGAPPPPTPRGGRGKKSPPPAAADRVELEVEPQ
jgi:hypothetical protein